ncbi:MAG TPA: adenylate kinase [Chthonomonas sp.]|jgi:adenylate kinase|uniref:adenylate kinase n=1 Tax=Chthonomonas sp. TaxID=2282153 RepID=UPI002B4B7EAE|nr:adenylate kinase [Chthonomonas sp.]HLH81054.1 adenylate kinase [Chthonomonas sp.]
MIIVLLGPPGVGKGTQGARISQYFGIPAISTGAMFREAIAKGTPLGKEIQKYHIEKGEYVPDDVVIRAIEERITEADCANGFLLDGFPRTVAQAEALTQLLEQQRRRLTAVLDFEAPQELLIRRLSGRRECPNDGSTYNLETNPPRRPGHCDLCGAPLVIREDDRPEVVQRRLEAYKEKTAPLIDYYRNKGVLYSVDANADPDVVFERVLALLNRLRGEAGKEMR